MAVEIIGRREELLAFDGFFEALPAGGQTLLLEGDAGIGKTALWQEGNRLAREHGFRVLTSRSAHSETQIAFATVGDLFASAVEDTLAQLTPVQRRALEAALLLREPDGPPPEVRLLGLRAPLRRTRADPRRATSPRPRRRPMDRSELRRGPPVHAPAPGGRAGGRSRYRARAAG